MQAAIAQHLNIAEEAIIKIEEWAHVLFVVARGLGGRFVSKKVPTMSKEKISAYDLADRITDAINESDSMFSATLWNKKEGETRIYVSYPSRKGKKDCGFIRITDSGVIDRRLTLQAGTIESLYSDVVNAVELVPVELKSNDPLTKKVVEECWECGATYTSYGNVEAGGMSCRRCG